MQRRTKLAFYHFPHQHCILSQGLRTYGTCAISVTSQTNLCTALIEILKQNSLKLNNIHEFKLAER